MQHVVDTNILFTPMRVNNTVVRNRFVVPAMQRGGVRNFSPTSEMTELMRQWGEGGTGIIICEGASPDHPACYWQPIFGAITRQNKENWREIAQAVSATGAVFLMQLWHVGALRRIVEGLPHPYPDQPALSPSGLVQAGRTNGVAMTRQDLEDTKAAYLECALIAKEVGAKGVEVHCAHGYLLDLFLWHETNQRDDEYGGATLAERARYPAEIVAEIREATGPDFIISVRFSQWKEVDYGAKIAQHPDELRPFLGLLEQAGADMFNISTRRFDQPAWPELDERRSLAAWVKGMTKLPVVAVGSVGLTTDLAQDVFDGRDPELMVEEDMVRVAQGIKDGDFDFIAIGRNHIANIDFVDRIRTGNLSGMRTFRKHEDLAMSADEGYHHEGQIVDEFRKTSE